MPRRDVSTPQGKQGLPGLRRRLGVCTTSMLQSLLSAPRLLALGALLTVLGVCTLAGCYISRTIDQAKASDVNNRNFAFTNGAVFHAGLTNVATALAFSNNAQDFTLCSSGNTASGTNTFGSCKLTVTSSRYSTGAGPQVNDVITLDPCDFDSDDHRLTVSNRGITTTSAVATTGSCNTSTPATPSQLSNQSCTFANGGVFDANLKDVSTTLAFNSTAQNFSLTSSGATTVSGTASGTSSIVTGSCSLTVKTSTYTFTLSTTITLLPCTFDNNMLTVSNRGLTVTSGACTTVTTVP